MGNLGPLHGSKWIEAPRWQGSHLDFSPRQPISSKVSAGNRHSTDIGWVGMFVIKEKQNELF